MSNSGVTQLALPMLETSASNNSRKGEALTSSMGNSLVNLSVKRVSDLARLLKLTYTVMGLAGEVGEFANIVKKIERDGRTIDEMLDQLVDELGDVVWYVFACADEIGIPLEDVAIHNLNKLAKRKAKRQLHDGSR